MLPQADHHRHPPADPHRDAPQADHHRHPPADPHRDAPQAGPPRAADRSSDRAGPGSLRPPVPVRARKAASLGAADLPPRRRLSSVWRRPRRHRRQSGLARGMRAASPASWRSPVGAMIVGNRRSTSTLGLSGAGGARARHHISASVHRVGHVDPDPGQQFGRHLLGGVRQASCGGRDTGHRDNREGECRRRATPSSYAAAAGSWPGNRPAGETWRRRRLRPPAPARSRGESVSVQDGHQPPVGRRRRRFVRGIEKLVDECVVERIVERRAHRAVLAEYHAHAVAPGCAGCLSSCCASGRPRWQRTRTAPSLLLTTAADSRTVSPATTTPPLRPARRSADGASTAPHPTAA